MRMAERMASKRRRDISAPSQGQGGSKAAVGAVADWVEDNLGTRVVREAFIGGSGWSSQYGYTCEDGRKLFVKTSLGRDVSMFEGEALGLRAMEATGTLKIPHVYHYGVLPTNSPGRGGCFIVMEHLELGGGGDDAALGRQLALMHLAAPTQPEAAAGRFGFPVDNTIGGTPQPNGWHDDWVTFFRERRLAHMLRLAGDTRLNKLGEQLLPRIGELFKGIDVRPSVLHGDLWSGNVGWAGGQPTIYDPATYYGHHEAEFGMAWCAGFSGRFWAAYRELIPDAPGAAQRRELYQLYHYLNHYVLFGGGYYGSCVNIMERLIAHLNK